MIDDAQIIAEAIKLVGEGVSVTFPVAGRSMRPFIVGGKESVVLVKPESVCVGDVVLAFVDNSRYVVHRVIRINGENVTLMGDGNLVGVEHCKVPDVKAIATHAVNARGKLRSFANPLRRAAAWAWVRLRPVRKWLLLAYRVYEKVFYEN
ncbi:MAG: S24/S26 family peptidase [Fibrobacter sp.]|nr:S24/S26 family peptidase [Fibrobacter sp.]